MNHTPCHSATAKRFCLGAVVMVILAIGVAFLRSHNKPAEPVAMSCLGVSASSNINFVSISIGITNQSDAKIFYVTCPPQVMPNASNAVWSKFQFPAGMPMAMLAPGQSGRMVVTMPASSGESRVPVLWGYGYSIPTTKWQQIREDVIGRLTGRNPVGRGFLHTNYVTNIKP